jgi:hypothetical protein
MVERARKRKRMERRGVQGGDKGCASRVELHLGERARQSERGSGHGFGIESRPLLGLGPQVWKVTIGQASSGIVCRSLPVEK